MPETELPSEASVSSLLTRTTRRSRVGPTLETSTPSGWMVELHVGAPEGTTLHGCMSDAIEELLIGHAAAIECSPTRISIVYATAAQGPDLAGAEADRMAETIRNELNLHESCIDGPTLHRYRAHDEYGVVDAVITRMVDSK